MTIKEDILELVQTRGVDGCTAFEAVKALEKKPQTIYPGFTQLCKAGEILDSGARRKSPLRRNSIVWVDKSHGGTLPVWSSGHPTYGYVGRAKLVLDLLFDYGALSASEMCTTRSDLSQMSMSSLTSHLRRQGWIKVLAHKRKNLDGHSCTLYELTPRGERIRILSPKVGEREPCGIPTIRKETGDDA